jgi:hypothetical protein
MNVPVALAQQATSGLTSDGVIKGDEQATRMHADRMKELHLHGVSIAGIREGRIEWVRGFGARQYRRISGYTRDNVSGRLRFRMATLRQVQGSNLVLLEPIDQAIASAHSDSHHGERRILASR